jgi:arginyl-tRNA synthetase
MAAPLSSFRRAFAKAVAESQGLSDDLARTIEESLEKPREEGRGDLALPCFALAKALGEKNPAAVAERIATALSQDPRWQKLEAVKAFVNVTFSTRSLAEAIVPVSREQGYGGSERDRGKTVVIDFSSPNIAKPLAFHHIRSTVIGAALGRIHRALGWEVRGINYLGDWGKQFGLLATGFSRHGDPAKRSDAKHLVEVYVTANREADVAGLKEQIAKPEEARRVVSDLTRTRASFPEAPNDKEKKTLEKAAARFEKRLREMRGMTEGDPMLDVETWLGEIEFQKVEAEARLPDAQEKDREARMFLKRMEEKDPEALATWKEFRDTSIADFQKIYGRMGVQFESIEGESFYQDVLDQTLERVRQKPGTRMSDGAEVVDLQQEGTEPPIILKTRDGTTLYVTRDIAAAMHRHERFSFARSLYVVAADQALHFRQLFRTLKAMGFAWAERCEHIQFGRIHGMSTRRGSVIFLDEVLEEAVAKARGICEQSDKIDRTHLAETVEAIGVGAIVFRDLKASRTTDYTFDWNEVLDFAGESGPYVQFSHARCCSIIKKAGGLPAQADLSLLTMDEERPILLALARYPEVLEKACDEKEPSHVTRAILELAKVTASYLTAGNRDRSKRVLLEDDDATRAARLHLIDAVRNTLAHGLGLLGVRAPEAM